MNTAIEDELRSTMMASMKKQIQDARKAQAEAEAMVQHQASLLIQQHTESFMEKQRLEELLNMEKQRLEELLKIERDAKAVLQNRLLFLENRPIPVFSEPKEPDLAPLMSIMLEMKAMVQQCMEPVDSMPKEFNILRDSAGKIVKIKVKE